MYRNYNNESFQFEAQTNPAHYFQREKQQVPQAPEVKENTKSNKVKD